MISAKEARMLTEEYRRKKEEMDIKNIITIIEERITIATNRGETSTTYFTDIGNLTSKGMRKIKMHFKNAGYKIKIKSAFLEGHADIIVSW